MVGDAEDVGVMEQSMTVRLCEVFGPTIQGEGPHTGQRVGFLRFAECNLACSWCDTPYSWDWTRFDKEQESRLVPVADAAKSVTALGVSRVVFTGGEPMMQQRFFPALHEEMDGILIDVETNGTILPSPSTERVVDLFVVSPKLAHSGDPEHLRLKQAPLARFSALAKEQRAVFKWVVTTPEDITAVEDVCVRFSIPREATWLMPEGATRDAHLERLGALADGIVTAGFNLSTRLHVLAWNDKRGV